MGNAGAAGSDDDADTRVVVAAHEIATTTTMGQPSARDAMHGAENKVVLFFNKTGESWKKD